MGQPTSGIITIDTLRLPQFDRLLDLLDYGRIIIDSGTHQLFFSSQLHRVLQPLRVPILYRCSRKASTTRLRQPLRVLHLL